jgi:hypothetical protein
MKQNEANINKMKHFSFLMTSTSVPSLPPTSATKSYGHIIVPAQD